VFSLGFHKISAFDRHNDGSEFKVSDTEPAPYSAGTGSMAPSGIPTFKPNDVNSNKLKPSTKKAMKQQAVDIAMLGKLGVADPGDRPATGSQGQGAETLVSQLKYETSSADPDEPTRSYGSAPKRLKKHKKEKTDE